MSLFLYPGSYLFIQQRFSSFWNLFFIQAPLSSPIHINNTQINRCLPARGRGTQTPRLSIFFIRRRNSQAIATAKKGDTRVGNPVSVNSEDPLLPAPGSSYRKTTNPAYEPINWESGIVNYELYNHKRETYPANYSIHQWAGNQQSSFGTPLACTPPTAILQRRQSVLTGIAPPLPPPHRSCQGCYWIWVTSRHSKIATEDTQNDDDSDDTAYTGVESKVFVKDRIFTLPEQGQWLNTQRKRKRLMCGHFVRDYFTQS